MAPESGSDTFLDTHMRVPQHVVFRAFVKETVLLNLQTGRYHGLNPVGGKMLESLKAGASVREVAAEVAKLYDEQTADVERDTADLCRDLLERGLIEEAPEGGG